MAKLEIDSDLCSFYITLASLWQPTYNAKTISQNFLSGNLECCKFIVFGGCKSSHGANLDI